MAINANHIVEEIGETRCAIVEKGISQERVDFLTELLNGNGYTVVVGPDAEPKKKAAAKPAEGVEIASEPSNEAAVSAPTKFTLGVTDLLFNSTNAIYGRILRANDGKVVTMAFWMQEEKISSEDTPYFQN